MCASLRAAWESLRATYPALPPDQFLPDGGAYRFRRYDSFTFYPMTGELQLLPHQDYFQSQDINRVTGGVVRQFAPLPPAITQNPFLHELIRFDFAHFPLTETAYQHPWKVDVHLIRVLAEPGATGQPTPEGVHRDGAAFITVHLAEHEQVAGGEVSIYDDNKTLLSSFRLTQVGDAYLFRDDVLWHGVTPIYPTTDQTGVRSILTFDYHPPLNL